MKGFLTTTGKTRRFISWFLASLLVISSFMYGGVTKVHAEEIDGATQLDAGEQGDQVDAPETVEQVNEEALPEAEVPEIEEGVTAADTDPGVNTGLVFTGQAQQLLSSVATKPGDALNNATVTYNVGAAVSSNRHTENLENVTATNAGTYTVYYGYRYWQRTSYTYVNVGSVEVTIDQADITKVVKKSARINVGTARNPRWVYSPFEYTGDVIVPDIYVEDENGYVLKEGTDFRVESGVTQESSIGSYSVNLLGVGNYYGSISTEWAIAPAPYKIYPTANWDIKAENFEVEYDGQPHPFEYELQNNAKDATIQFLLAEDGEEIGEDDEAWDEATSEVPEFTEVGEYTVYYKVYSEEPKDYEGNPICTPYFGKEVITITEKEVWINVDDVTKPFDGQPFGDELDIVSFGDGEGGFEPLPEEPVDANDIEVVVDEAYTEVGEYPAEVANLEALAEKYPNYIFVLTGEGTATITKRPVTISLKESAYTRIYSGEPIDLSEEINVEPFDEEAGTGVVEGEPIIGMPVILTSSTTLYNTRVVDDYDLDSGEYFIMQYSTNRNGNPNNGILPNRNTNYDITFIPSTYTVEKKNIEDVEDVTGTRYFDYTGKKINVNIRPADYVGGQNLITSSDYKISGEVSATNFGIYTVGFEATEDGNYYGKLTETWGIVAYAELEEEYDGDYHMFEEADLTKAYDDGAIVELIGGSDEGIRFSLTNPGEITTEEEFVDALDMTSLDDVAEAFEDNEMGKDVSEDPYTFYYGIRLRGGQYFVSKATITIIPAELVIDLSDAVPTEPKVFDGTTLVEFKDTEVEGRNGDKFLATNLAGNLADPNSNNALGLDDDDTRTVFFRTADLAAIELKPANTESGANPNNYVVTKVEGAETSVAMHVITDEDITLTVADKQYDGTDVAEATITVDTDIEGQEIIFKDIEAYFEDADVSWDNGKVTDQLVTVSAIPIPGNDETNLKNYDYIPDNEEEEEDEGEPLVGLAGEIPEEGDKIELFTTAAITPREILVTPSSGTKIYDGKVATTETINPTFTVEGVDEEIAKNDDFAEQLLSEPETVFTVKLDDKVEAKNAGEYVLLVYTDDEYADKFVEGNFSLGINQGTYTITPKAVTVKVNDASKKVGEADPTFQYTVDGLVSGESLKNIKVTRVAGEAAGTYKVSATSDADKNYAITYVDGTFTIEASYSNEWVDGQWYDADGKADYAPKGSWKQNATGWWYEDTSGWYPVNSWQKIDGLWYYFGVSGYMAAGEWIDGWWCDADGACRYEYQASWKQDSTGWWYGDPSGWYAQGSWQKIDNVWYYFGADGYMVTSQYVDGYWVNADGAWAE